MNIRDLFGLSAVSEPKLIELVIEVERQIDVAEVERLGLDRHEEDIFGVKITKFVLPMSAGRNLSILIETPSEFISYAIWDLMRRKLG